MRNPLRSEQEAFRFVLLTIGYFALIVIASVIDRWLGLAVFVALTAVGGYFAFVRPRGEGPPPSPPPAASPPGERRILVIANETVGGGALRDCIRKKAEGVHENVLVVAPALNSPLRHLASDEDDARAAAQARVEASVAKLREAGIDAHGEIGDADPLQTIDDALRAFGPDEVIISTHPEGKSHWLERGVVTSARERFPVPITHVIVDLETQREEVL